MEIRTLQDDWISVVMKFPQSGPPASACLGTQPDVAPHANKFLSKFEHPQINVAFVLAIVDPHLTVSARDESRENPCCWNFKTLTHFMKHLLTTP
jgi:hypothetical protein